MAARDWDVLICGVRTGEVVALSLAEGHVLWRTRISGKSPVVASCALTGERVYAVSTDGYLAVLDAKDGKVAGAAVYLNDQGKPAGTDLSSSAPHGGTRMDA